MLPLPIGHAESFLDHQGRKVFSCVEAIPDVGSEGPQYETQREGQPKPFNSLQGVDDERHQGMVWLAPDLKFLVYV